MFNKNVIACWCCSSLIAPFALHAVNSYFSCDIYFLFFGFVFGLLLKVNTNRMRKQYIKIESRRKTGLQAKCG